MTDDLEKKLALTQSRAARLKQSQREAEQLLEAKSFELYHANQQLAESEQRLKQKVAEATSELSTTNQELRKTLEEKSKFVGAISHELRTPLNAIIGLSELIDLQQLASNQKDYIKTIRESAQSLMALINEVLEVTQIDSGRATLAPVAVNIDDNSRFIHELFRLEARKKGLKLSFQNNDLPEFLLFDVRRYNQIINNLISNALKNTDQGGIEFTSDYNARGDGFGDLITTIKDTGKGISTEDQLIIFDLYEQIGQPGKGIGMGLTLCKRLCELMNGNIRCQSDGKSGSTFIVTLPVQETDASQAKAAETVSTAALPELAILVAEDNLVNQKVIRAQFDQLGLNIDIAANGKLALEHLNKRRYDAVFLDILMPEMNGEETLAHIRQSTDLQGLHCIALTAASFQEQGQRLLDMGFDQFLSKPVMLNQLSETLQKIAPKKDKKSILFKYLKNQLKEDFHAVFAEVGPIFVQEMEKKAKDLENAIEQKDAEQVRFLCHSMKGESLSMGFNDLANLLQQLEHNPDSDQATVLFNSLKPQLQDTFNCIEQQLG